MLPRAFPTTSQVSDTARNNLEVKGKIHLNHAEITIPGGLPPEVAAYWRRQRDGAPAASPFSQALVTPLNVEVDAPNRILIK